MTSTVEMTSNYTTDSTTDVSNLTVAPVIVPHQCLVILYKTFGTSTVGIWDVLILLPNFLFFLYLLLKSCSVVRILRRSNSPIFSIIYILIFTAVVMGLLRCFVSMAINSSTNMNTVDRILWLVLKFFLLATELSVVTFGLLLVHLDSRTSVRKVVLVAFTFSLIYSTCQGVLEFVYINKTFHGEIYVLFGHGGLLFWFASSLVLFLVYIIICGLPYTPLAQRLILPAKRSFYIYCLILSMVDLTQAVSSILLHYGHMNALCVVDVTSYLYFTCFAPFVYIIFLRGFFKSYQTMIPFSYGRPLDDDDDIDPPRQLNYDPPPMEGANPLENVTDMIASDAHYSCGSPLFNGLGARPELSLNADLGTGHVIKSHDNAIKI